ncbi:MAG: GNAT family N-acetyltransferase [Firmicutes bacterium]|nr:GNAT family N-acetyltransferase [Bacillota bacterium]
MAAWFFPAPGAEAGLLPEEQLWAMEATALEVRRLWFGGQVQPFYGGVLLRELGTELVALLRARPEEAPRLVEEVRQRRAQVVVTPFSQPRDLAVRLRRAGFYPVARQGAYVYRPSLPGPQPAEGRPPAVAPRRRGLVPWPPGWLRRWLRPAGPAGPLAIAPISAEGLPEWNRVCWEAFGPPGLREEASLFEKERAFVNMGSRALWYLARLGQEPVGTAILYLGDQAAQILAVGTRPGYRRRGVATALVCRAIADFRARSRGVLFLDTWPGSGAERLYLRLGFRRAYIRTMYAPG